MRTIYFLTYELLFNVGRLRKLISSNLVSPIQLQNKKYIKKVKFGYQHFLGGGSGMELPSGKNNTQLNREELIFQSI